LRHSGKKSRYRKRWLTDLGTVDASEMRITTWDVKSLVNNGAGFLPSTVRCILCGRKEIF